MMTINIYYVLQMNKERTQFSHKLDVYIALMTTLLSVI